MIRARPDQLDRRVPEVYLGQPDHKVRKGILALRGLKARRDHAVWRVFPDRKVPLRI